jgi:pimeloyl-ACP methyl ester carboxylesterase
MRASMLRRALLSLSSQVAAGFDQVVYNTALARSDRSRQRSRAEGLSHAERLEALAKVREEYGKPGYIEDPGTFFPGAPSSEGRVSKVRTVDLNIEVLDVRWRSDFTPLGSGVSARYRSHEENEVAVARLITRRQEKRPAVVVIHGYLGGELGVEERVMPVDWLLAQGLDVALFVLPFHGDRRRGKLTRPVFPSSDPRFTIEGFRQAVGDARWLVRWLRERGAPSVGVLGMSLGGYTTSLLATLEPELSFAVPLVPLASLADFARDGGRLVGTAEEQAEQYTALEETFRVVSPLGRPSALPGERVLVVAGEADRITPLAHAERLATHLGGRLERFPGGHLWQLGRERALAPLAGLIARAATP